MDIEAEKLSRFESAVAAEIEGQVHDILEDAQRMREEILEAANDRYINNAYYEIQGNLKEISSEYVKQLSQYELEAKREVIKHRSDLVDGVFESVINKLIEFTKTEKYVYFIINQLKDLDEKNPFYEGVTVYIKPSDKDLIPELTAKVPVPVFAEDKMIKIGGVSVFYPKEHIIIDKTFDNGIVEEKERFIMDNVQLTMVYTA